MQAVKVCAYIIKRGLIMGHIYQGICYKTKSHGVMRGKIRGNLHRCDWLKGLRRSIKFNTRESAMSGRTLTPPQMSTSQSPEPMNLLSSTAEGTLQT